MAQTLHIGQKEVAEMQFDNGTMNGFSLHAVPPSPSDPPELLPDIVLAIGVIGICVLIGIAIAKFADFVYDIYIKRYDRLRTRSRLLARATALTIKTTDVNVEKENVQVQRTGLPSTLAVSAAVKWMRKAGDISHTKDGYSSPSEDTEPDVNPRNETSRNSVAMKCKKRKSDTTLMEFTPSLTNEYDSHNAFPRKESALSLGATAKWIDNVHTLNSKQPDRNLEYSSKRRNSRGLAMGSASRWLIKTGDANNSQEQEPLA